ncbi:hypothetical protein K0C01_02585 [Salinarchaeum sp. IM2453]|uniref:hypothetical protein n=1 Tax=Salinarchaeum sp. IM2453 TaxID=2862870 RepID=UPI001C828926|nr:hypothetical protein [Salinarchaeum sp. IM2453]QZA89067.1 hypothetical protein K0C01_02585 [Salinarchaeum sp. IM2453]
MRGAYIVSNDHPDGLYGNEPSSAPSALVQFAEHNRCPRWLNQHVDPHPEAGARAWQEAFGLMNITLLGKGKEFEARQIETLVPCATTIIGPDLPNQSKAAIPAMAVDTIWADSASCPAS